MSRVLVTGGSGFVGLPTLARLVETGAEVHALTTRRSPPELPGVRWCAADLADAAAVEAVLDELRPERLLHLAWYVEHGRFWEAPENVVWVERSLRLLRAFARAGGQRALMLGTCAEYDWSVAEGPLHETVSPIGPLTLYGVAKDALRRVSCAYCELEGLELAWGRLFFVYGPRESPGRLVPSVIRALLAGERVPTTAGAQRRDFLHVDDLARAIVAVMEDPLVGPVNLARGQAVAVAEIVDQIALEIGRPELVQRGSLPDRPGEPELLLADVGRLRDEVGFVPCVSLAAGLADAVEYWRPLGSSAAVARERA